MDALGLELLCQIAYRQTELLELFAKALAAMGGNEDIFRVFAVDLPADH